MRKDVREIIDWAKDQGCVFLGVQKNGHNALETPDGVRVTFSNSPSDVHASHNLKRDVCAALGIEVERSKFAGRFTHKKKRSRLNTHLSQVERHAQSTADGVLAEIESLDRHLLVLQRRGERHGLMEALARREVLAEKLSGLFKPVPAHPFGDVSELVGRVLEDRVGSEQD